MKTRTALAAWLGCLCMAASSLGGEPTVLLIEAESFQDHGGWVLDQQFMDQMGSPMLLAHGMGQPVADATTTVAIPAPGTYRVLVRTRDWAATFDAPGSPGRFQLSINGQPLKTTFGTEGAQWHWQDGGTVALAGGNVKLALHDLTGFDGRCDAIVLASEPGFMPPNEAKPLARFRRQSLGLPERPDEVGPFDLVVVGGGMAGACAAVSAARLGLDVALVQDRPVLGGNNSSEVRVHLGGGIHLPPYPALGGVVRELDSGRQGNAQPAAYYDDQKKLAVVRAEKNLRLFLNTHALSVEKQGNRIAAVIAQDTVTGRSLRISGLLFADCTGDGAIGYLAGADYHYGRESRAETAEALAPEKPDRQTMGTSIMWYSADTGSPATFPDCPWAIQFNEKNYQRATEGGWNWETGFRLDQIDQFEHVRDHGLRAVYGNWAYQKNHAKDKAKYANRKLDWVAYVGGKRESRRLLGDVLLRQEDVVAQREFPDASVTTTWSIDLHYPIQSDQFPGEEFRSKASFLQVKPYAIPYRCLYSRNVDNLFMAGRNISVSHVALGTIRVMRTTGMMGEVVGMAAAVCKKYSARPRDVYTNYLGDLKELMTQGVGKLPLPAVVKPPEWLKTAGTNLARSAQVSVASQYPGGQFPAQNVNDGRVGYTDNNLRYVSGPQLPGQIELAWDKPQTISAARIVSGQSGGDAGPKTPITDFVLQYHDGAEYRDIPGTKTTGNLAGDWNARFPPVVTGKIRLIVTATPGDLTRIWEIELYNPPPAAAAAAGNAGQGSR